MELQDVFKTGGRINSRVTYALLRIRNRFTERRADEFGEKAVILGLVVIVGIGAWSMFGDKVVAMVNQTTAGM